MPLPLFPEVPIPAVVFPGSIEWPAIEAQFDSVYRQVRQLTNRGLRTVELSYPFVTLQELDSLITFFNKRKGKAERFDLKIPIDTLVDPGFELGTTNEWSFSAGAQITTNPVNVRTGQKAGQITALNGTARLIAGLQLFALFPGDQILLSGYAKADGAPGGTGSMYVEFYDATDAFVSGGPTTVDQNFGLSYDPYTATPVTVPATVAYGRVFARSAASATTGRVLHFDDLSVRLQIPFRFADRIEWSQRPDAFSRYSCTVKFIESP